MNIDETIQRCVEVAKGRSDLCCYMQPGKRGDHLLKCLECAVEHRQIAEWLKELKAYKESTDAHDTNVGSLISRQDAIDAAINAVDEWDGGSSPTRADMIVDAINNTVPSVERKRDKGEWIWSPEEGYKCSNCGMIWMRMVYPRNFCTNCGADMRGE